MAVFRAAVPCSTYLPMVRPEDAGSEKLWNVGKLLPGHIAQKQKTTIFILTAVKTWNLTNKMLGSCWGVSILEK
jgi:hypothetical protein